jgi:hypothetical protein
VSWIQLALALLKLANIFADWGRERGQLKAGEDAALGRAAVDVLRATEWGKAITDKIDAMEKPALDDITDDLGRADDLGNAKR